MAAQSQAVALESINDALQAVRNMKSAYSKTLNAQETP